MRKSGDRHFWWIAAAVFGLMATLNHLPMFAGRIPFPRDHVLRHSAWAGQPRTGPPQQVAQLIDVVAMIYPFRALLSRAGNEGTVPLWNPYIMAGAPFQANAQSSVFYPPNLLYYVLPLNVAWTASLTLRLFLAALFMAFFVRAIGGSDGGALVAGILFALCGFTIEWQGSSPAESSIWLPLIAYGVVRLYRQPGASSIAIAGLAFALPVLGGHPETAIHCTMAGCALALWLWIERFDRRFLGGFVLAGVLALGLACVQWVPSLEWLGQLGPQIDNAQPVLDRHQGQGFFSRDILRDPSSALVQVPEGAAYVGMLGILAALLALFHPSRRYVIFLAGLAVAATAIAFGIQPVRWVVVHIPVFKALKNGRMILLVDFALAALAGLGVSQLDERRSGAKAWLVLGAGIAASCLAVYEVQRATMIPVEFSRGPWASLIFVGIAVVPLAYKLRGGLKAWRFPAVMVLVAGFEMLTYSYGYLGFSPASEVFSPPPVVDFLRSRGDPATFRVARDRVPMPHDSGMVFGFAEADGYEIATERARMFASGLTEDRPDGVMFQGESILRMPDRRFDMLNARYLVATTPNPHQDLYAQHRDRFVPVFSQGSVTVYENRAALPRVIAVPLPGIEIIAGRAAQLQRLKEPSFDPLRSVIFSQAPQSVPAGNPAGQNAAGGRVEILESKLNESSLRVEAAAPQVVVVSQTYYPGWKATVDGAEVPVYPVNLALTGVVVSAGAHHIRLFFQPLSFRIGAGISLLSLAAIVGLFWAGRRDQRNAFRRE